MSTARQEFEYHVQGARVHAAAFLNTVDDRKMSQEHIKIDGKIDDAPVEITESMRRIAAYIAEFQAKYKQLEDEQRKRRRQQGEDVLYCQNRR